jgi:hypothetical protein
MQTVFRGRLPSYAEWIANLGGSVVLKTMSTAEDAK